MSNMNELIFAFKEHLKMLNQSEATIESYASHVGFFLDTVNGLDVKEIKRGMLENYVAGLFEYRNKDNQPYSTSTIGIKVRAVKRFFEFLEKTNHIFIDPAEYLKEPKREKRLPRSVLTPAEVSLLLDQPNLGTLIGIRDRAMLEVFYSTGIRREELCSLCVYDADFSGGMLRVRKGKGRKQRVVPLGKHAVKFLKEYIAKVRPHFTRKNRTNRHLFVDSFGKPLSKAMVSVLVTRYGKAANIKKKVNCHMFRHTFATALLKNGADILAVQKMMGHVDLQTTQGYVRTLVIDVKAMHTKSHPREKDTEDRHTVKPKLERMIAQNERKENT
jgi:integrase/recombinase XerD